MTITAERTQRQQHDAVLRTLAWGGAAAFAVAGCWYGLALRGITVAAEPTFTSAQPQDERDRIYTEWMVSTFAQERLYTALACVALCCFAGTVLLRCSRLVRTPASLLSAAAICTGAGLWLVGNVIQLGGHHAVEIMSTHGNPLPVVDAVGFSVEMLDDAFELSAFVLLSVGMLLHGLAGARGAHGAVAWSRYTTAVGLVMLATAVSYVLDSSTELLLLAQSVVLMPVWMVWTGQASAGNGTPMFAWQR